MKHLTRETMDAWLDGQLGPLPRWLAARHVARCPECQKTRAACEADRALLDDLRRDMREYDAMARALPATLVVAPSLSQKARNAAAVP